MITHALEQGTQAWHDYRAKHFNASDAPAMLGISTYKTRSQLLKEMATGIPQEFDAATERRFADGHRFEALARSIAEGIIGSELYPVTASEGKLSASFDGLTIDETICFEHKTLNDAIRKVIFDEIPEQYRAQMEQQLMISGAEKCLFMASQWDKNDVLIEECHVWYSSDQAMRERIVHGWVQFSKDLETYTPPEVIEKPVAEVIMGLPAVSVQATGMVTASNLPEFKKAADTFIANIKTELISDEDFVNAEANVKFCKSAEDDLEGAKKSMLAQTSSINEVITTIDFIKGQLASKRLMLDKLVKSEKESRKLAIISKAGIAFSAHVESLEGETRPIQLYVMRPDFAGAMKGLKKLSAMQEAVDTVLRNAVFEADKVAKDIRTKLAWCKEHASGHSALFPDLQGLVAKPLEDFVLTITSRIEKFKADEAEKEAALIAKVRLEEEAKARAKVEAEERARIAADKAKQDAEIKNELTLKQYEKIENLGEVEPVTKASNVVEIKQSRPTDAELIQCIADGWNVSHGQACYWIIATAESMRVAA